MPRRSELALAVSALVALMALLHVGRLGSIRAQGNDGRPAQIHQGTCDGLGPAAFRLTGVGAAVGLDGTPVAASEEVGPDSALPVATSATTVEMALGDLVAGGHALAVYESDEAMESVIACGDFGGRMMMQMAGMTMPGDELAVGLATRNDSGYAGTAVLRAAGGSRTTVTVYLAAGLAGQGDAGDGGQGTGTPPAG